MPPAPMFLSAARIDSLAAFQCPDADAVTLHLAVDPGGLYPSTLHQLAAEARRAPALKRLSKDFDRLEAFVNDEFTPGPNRLLVACSSVKRGLFEAFTLPQPFKSALVVGESLDLRPYHALARQYHRFLAVLAGPDKTRFVELFMGHAQELETTGGDLAAAAARAAALVRERRVDRVVLGAAEETAERLTGLLDAEVQRDLILEPVLGPNRPLDAVLERVLHNERQARAVRESVLVHRLFDEARQGGAVTGLDAVAAAVEQGCVSRVLVRDGYAKMGRSCPSCGRLSVSNRSCPWCFRATDSVLDLVGELVDKALAMGCEVYRVMHDARFDGVCRIGAELKVPVDKPAPPPTSRALRGFFATKQGHRPPLR